MSTSLNFIVRVTSSGRPLREKDWAPIAKRLAMAAKGRSKARSSIVHVDLPYEHIRVAEDGAISHMKGGHDIAFGPPGGSRGIRKGA